MTIPASNGGKACAGEATETATCNTDACPDEFNCYQCWQKSSEENMECWDLNLDKSDQVACPAYKYCIITKIGIEVRCIKQGIRMNEYI